MTERPRNIFLVHTPWQLTVAEQMITHMPEFEGGEHILCIQERVRGESMRTPKAGVFQDIIPLHYVAAWKWGREAWRKMQENASTIRELAKGRSGVRIFLSDILWYTNNRIFFDRTLKKQCEFSLFEEGVGIYLNQDYFGYNFNKHLLKMALGYTTFAPAIRGAYRGHMMGLEHPRIRKIYAFRPEVMPVAGQKAVAIPPLTPQEVILNPEKLVFLHQTFSWCKDAATWQAFFARTLELLQTIPAKEYWVKPHPHYASDADMALFKQHGFKILETNNTAEEMIAEEHFGIVTSWLSSGLVNIKNIYPQAACKTLQLQAIVDNAFIPAKAGEDWQELLETLGIPIME